LERKEAKGGRRQKDATAKVLLNANNRWRKVAGRKTTDSHRQVGRAIAMGRIKIKMARGG